MTHFCLGKCCLAVDVSLKACSVWAMMIYFGNLSSTFSPQWLEREKHLPGGCHAQARDHVWADQLLAAPGHEVHRLWDGQRGHLHLHAARRPQHVLPGLHQGQRRSARGQGADGRGGHPAACRPGSAAPLGLTNGMVEFWLERKYRRDYRNFGVTEIFSDKQCKQQAASLADKPELLLGE